jgi:molecular chaperone GrpE
VSKKKKAKSEGKPDPGASLPSSPEETPGGEEEGRSAEDLKTALEKLAEDARVAEDKYLRALAELDNTRKRLSREKADWLRFGHEGVVKDLLPIIDNLERALEAASAIPEGEGREAGSKGLIEGVALILKQFLDALARHGIVPIESVGKPFDPNLHEAMQRAEREDAAPGTVVQEFLKGYLLHGRLLRPAKVVVSAERAGSKAEGEAPGASGRGGNGRDGAGSRTRH